MIQIFSVLFLFGAAGIHQAAAFTKANQYPRTGNYYLRAGADITPTVATELAQYDLVVLPAEVQVQNPTLFEELRKRHAGIIILAYVPTVSYNTALWHDTLHANLLSSIKPEWWLMDIAGHHLSIAPGTEALNMTSDWAEYLAAFVHSNIVATKLWDGIFYDEVDACISCRNLGTIDLNRNGTSDDATTADHAWQAGYVRLLESSRALEGAATIIMMNGSSFPSYQPYVNGRMFESFPTPWEGNGSWSSSMQSYLALEHAVGAKPPLFFLDSDTKNTGVQNYRSMRFGLTSTLLGGGYFGYDVGTENHGQLWRFDEGDAYLGPPISPPVDLMSPNTDTVSADVWRRDFEEGVVMVNATAVPQTVALHNDFEKLHGTQDAITNDGTIVSQVTIPAADGVMLLRHTEQIIGAAFANGNFARVFKSDGAISRTGFFSYDARFRGASHVLYADLKGDGAPETVVSDRGEVTVWSPEGKKQAHWNPYGPKYHGDIAIAIGDVTGDNRPEIVTGAGRGGGPQVRIFAPDGHAIGPGFFAFDAKQRGGVSVAVSDIDGDGTAEIITGEGAGATPQVRIFRSSGTMKGAGFLAYDPLFRGGITVAAGDVNGDGQAEIITGAGQGGGPQVRIFTKTGTPLGRGFFAYNPDHRDGVAVATADLDHDGKMEIIALSDHLAPSL